MIEFTPKLSMKSDHKHILSIFEAEKQHLLKHTEAQLKKHYAYKKKSVVSYQKKTQKKQ